MIKRVYKILLISMCFSCSETNLISNCFDVVANDEISTKDFINVTDRTLINFIPIDREYKIFLKRSDLYNYKLLSNRISNDCIYIAQIDKNKMLESYNYKILKLKKDKEFKILDSITLKSDFINNSISKVFLSNDKSKIAVVYNLPNNKSILKIINSKTKHVFFEKKYLFQMYLYQSPWSTDDNRITFFNSKKEIFILNYNLNETVKLPSVGINAMWLQTINKISYFDTKNSIRVYDLKTKEDIELYRVKNNFLSNNQILDYYWFSTQKKMYIKSRFTNRVTDKIWSDKNFVLNYKCNN